MTQRPGQHGELAPELVAELEAHLEQLAELATKLIARSDFYDQWLEQAKRLCPATSGHVWDIRQSPPRQIASESDPTAHPAPQLKQFGGGSTALPVRVDLGGAGQMLLAPIVVDGQVVAVAELTIADGNRATTDANHLELLAAACEIAADYEIRSNRGALAGNANFWRQLAELAAEISHADSVELTEQMIVTAARTLVPCERATLVQTTRGSVRTVAVSDTVWFERRSEKVRSLESLAQVVANQNEPVWHDAEANSSHEELSDLIEAALDEGNVRWLAGLPLAEPGTAPHAVLVLEGGDNAVLADMQQRADHLVGICAAPLASVYDHAGLPLLGISRWLRDMFIVPLRRRWIKLAIAVATIAAIVAILTLVPAELTVEARGQLLPVERRHVFAPAEGIISNVLVTHGDRVRAGDKLLTMRSEPLRQEATRLQGELESTAQRIRALNSARALNEATPGEEQRAEQFRISAELSQLEAVNSSLQQQLAIVQLQQEQLTVTSPTSGEVLTWQVEESLTARPVSHGQRLLTVANTRGDWEVDLEVPAEEIALVRQAIDRRTGSPAVTFVLEASPQHELKGEIERVSRSAQQTDDETVIVPVVVSVERKSLKDPLPAAGVRARIACGKHALGYVWFRQLIRYAQMNWF